MLCPADLTLSTHFLCFVQSSECEWIAVSRVTRGTYQFSLDFLSKWLEMQLSARARGFESHRFRHQSLENSMFSRLFLCSGSIYFGENNSNGALGAPLCGARLIPHHTHYTRKMYTVVPQWCPELLKSYGKQRGAIKRYCRYSSISLLFFFAFFDVSCPASFPVTVVFGCSAL